MNIAITDSSSSNCEKSWNQINTRMFSYCFISILEKFHICESHTICNSALQCDILCVGCAFMAWMQCGGQRSLSEVFLGYSHWAWNSPFRLGCLACVSPLPVFFLSGALGLQMCAAMGVWAGPHACAVRTSPTEHLSHSQTMLWYMRIYVTIQSRATGRSITINSYLLCGVQIQNLLFFIFL